MTGLLRKHPRNHTVCFGMGVLCALKEEHKEAIGWFDKATGIFPYFIEAHFNKAVAYQRQLDVANAIRAFRKVVEVGDPNEPEVKQAQSFLDHIAETLHRNDGVDLDTFLESNAAFNRAFTLMEQGEWANALEGFRACIAKNERNAPSHGNMGLCLAKLGRKAEAWTALNRALVIDQRYEPAMTNRVAVERMEEGHPLNITAFKRIDYGKECVLREKSNRSPFFAKLAALFTNRR